MLYDGGYRELRLIKIGFSVFACINGELVTNLQSRSIGKHFLNSDLIFCRWTCSFQNVGNVQSLGQRLNNQNIPLFPDVSLPMRGIRALRIRHAVNCFYRGKVIFRHSIGECNKQVVIGMIVIILF